MLRTIALGAEFLGNSVAALALLRLAFARISATPRELLFASFLTVMGVFCLTNVGYAVIIAMPDNTYIGWGSTFEAVAETVQILTFMYASPVLLTIIACTNILHKRGFNFRKIGVS
jgi:hypothetical protein